MTDPGDAHGDRFFQQVTAVNGFAFGAVDADIHVFASGMPLYLLADWRIEEPADPEWLRELPSRMLNARRHVVPFVGREDDLARLDEWRDTGPRLAVRWLHGPGGQGKTRLAAEFAARSRAAGWKVVAAFHGPDADPIKEGTQRLGPAGHTGLLVVVDYADRWQVSALTWLLKNNLLHRTGVATRVLMVARTADAWPAVKGLLDEHQAGTSGHLLAPLDGAAEGPGGAAGERGAMFEAARDSFALIYGRPSSGRVPPPDALAGPDFGLTLAVHMAALVAVDGHGSGGDPPPDMARLTTYLLNREHLHWARLYGDGDGGSEGRGDGAPGSSSPRPFRTPPETMTRLVFTAGLTGALPRAGGLAVLERLGASAPAQSLDDHAFCYPAADDALALEPLYPDRLTEDFLALTLPGHDADHPPQRWAPTTTTILLARTGTDGEPPAWTPRCLTFLADAAVRWPHLAPYLNTILRKDPALATAAGSAALSSLARVPGIDVSLFHAVHDSFPYWAPDLAPGVADITLRLGELVLAGMKDDARRASFHEELCLRLSAAGRHTEALASARTAVTLSRPAAGQEDPRALRRYARSLHALGTALWAVGRYEEALRRTDGAAILRRRAHNGSPESAHELAHTLDNRSTLLSKVGRYEEALDVRIEAQDLWRSQVRLYEGAAGASESLESMLANLAQSLDHLGGVHLHLGEHDRALPAVVEAVALYEQLVPDPLAEDSVPHLLPKYQAAVSTLGTALIDSGRWAEACDAFRRAVAMGERLAAVNPQAHENDLLDHLSNLGAALSMTGRHGEALEVLEKTLARYEVLARTNPVLHGPDVARVSTNLIGVYARERGPQAALTAAERAVDLYRRLAAERPRVHEPTLAKALTYRGENLTRLGRHPEAVASIREAVDIQQRFAPVAPLAHEPDLAEFLVVLSTSQTAAGAAAEAAESATAALAIATRLAASDPAVFGPLLRRARALAASD
ncbi:tetratricopeptide repeat protein [Streptomyces sp. NPDC056463]|uniref:tetratricopeptide repeat protein n=1 Tax=Streptomyces sp. NPDC056463 TaxID=3345827 RepID=UPI0036C52444